MIELSFPSSFVLSISFIIYNLDVENSAARHTHDTSFVQIASGSALVCGFGFMLRIEA